MPETLKAKAGSDYLYGDAGDDLLKSDGRMAEQYAMSFDDDSAIPLVGLQADGINGGRPFIMMGMRLSVRDYRGYFVKQIKASHEATRTFRGERSTSTMPVRLILLLACA